MNAQTIKRLIWLFHVAVICVLNCGPSIAERRYEDDEILWCEEQLKKILHGTLLARIPVMLFEQHQKSGTGIVHSEFKTYHEIIQLYMVLRQSSKDAIGNYLKLDRYRCYDQQLCQAFDNIVADLNDGKNNDEFSYTSRVYFDESYESCRVDVCATPVPVLNFKAGAEFTAVVSQGYKDFCRTDAGYLGYELDRFSVFQFVNTMRMTANFFGKAEFISSDKTFRDLDHKLHKVSWVKMSGSYWIGSYYPQRQDPQSECPRVSMYRTEVANSSFYVLYFKPDVFKTYKQVGKAKCLKEILLKMREKYMQKAIDKVHDEFLGEDVSQTIAIPMTDISNDIELKGEVETHLYKIFMQKQVRGVGYGYVTFNEFRSWEYYNNKPEDYYRGQSPKIDTELVHYIRSPFVLAVVDIKTNIILKMGAVMRPSKI